MAEQAAHAARRSLGRRVPLDAVHTGTTGGDPARDVETVASYAAAGVTWWIEDISPYRFGQAWEDQWMPGVTELIRERVRQGPPQT